jgi:hypothetical protein
VLPNLDVTLPVQREFLSVRVSFAVFLELSEVFCLYDHVQEELVHRYKFGDVRCVLVYRDLSLCALSYAT